MDSSVIMRSVDLELSYGRFVLAERVNLTVCAGRAVGITGPNGCGKTTLLNSITGWHSYARGMVSIRDQEIGGLGPSDIARLGVRRSFQGGRVLDELLLPQQMAFSRIGPIILRASMLFGRHELARETSEARRVLETRRPPISMRKLPWDRPLAEFSGGFQRLADTLTSLHGASTLCVLDEPFGGLGNALRDYVESVIRECLERGVALLVVDHDRDRLLRVAHDAYTFVPDIDGRFKLDRVQ